MRGTEWLRLTWRRELLPAVSLVVFSASCQQQKGSGDSSPEPAPAVAQSPAHPGQTEDPGGANPASRSDDDAALDSVLTKTALRFLFTAGRSAEQVRLLYLERNNENWLAAESAVSDERMRIGADAELLEGPEGRPFVSFSALLKPELERPRMVTLSKHAPSGDAPQQSEAVAAVSMPANISGASDCIVTPHVRKQISSDRKTYVLFTCTVASAGPSGHACHLRFAAGKDEVFTPAVTLAVTAADRACGVFKTDRPALALGHDGSAHIAFRARLPDAGGWTIGYTSGAGTDFSAPYYIRAANGSLTGFPFIQMTNNKIMFLAWQAENTPMLFAGREVSRLRKLPVPLSLRKGEMVFALSGFMMHEADGGR